MIGKVLVCKIGGIGELCCLALREAIFAEQRKLRRQVFAKSCFHLIRGLPLVARKSIDRAAGGVTRNEKCESLLGDAISKIVLKPLSLHLARVDRVRVSLGNLHAAAA